MPIDIDMRDMKELLNSRQDLWQIFTKRNEYSINTCHDYKKNCSNIKNFNVKVPDISRFLMDSGLKLEYPENKNFAVFLTHDVDDIYPPKSHTFISSLYHIKNFEFDKLKDQLFWKYRGRQFSPYWNFKEIMKVEDKYNAKSSFYFIASDHDILRFRYNIEDLENELGIITDNGWEIGLHGGYFSFDNLEEILKEKKRLEKIISRKVIGYRNHYLRFKVPTTWDLLRDAGFKYDTTFGYNDMTGFRNGMCHPFWPFNLKNDQYIDILEIPLIMMDTALFWSSKTFDNSWTNAKYLIDIVEKYNGVLTLSWHNYVFSCPFRKQWTMLYEKILKYCHKKNAWMTNGEDIWKWWTYNNV